MHRLGHADAGEVTVALVGEDDVVGVDALGAGGDCGGTSMRCLDHVAAEELVGHDGTAHGADTDGLPLDTELVHGLGHEAVHDAMGAAGAVVRDYRQERIRTLEHDLLGIGLAHATHLPSR